MPLRAHTCTAQQKSDRNCKAVCPVCGGTGLKPCGQCNAALPIEPKVICQKSPLLQLDLLSLLKELDDYRTGSGVNQDDLFGG
eukprot:scaffold649719_cov51-Prasinocladus_malaysianus.AAC.1